MSTERQERVAPPPPGHPKNVPVASAAILGPRLWVRLANRAYTNQFYPSLKSRLTPSSGRYPCAYIAPSKETAVAELWGDAWTLAKRRGKTVFVMVKEKSDELCFLGTSTLPALALCDFTDRDTRLSIGLDAAAIYTHDLSIPQEWAEMIATHPNNYDGILYRSRHTDEQCVVLWSRPGVRDLSAEISFSQLGPFRESAAAYAVADKIGIRLSWVSGRG